jgi:hypothetical protein
MTQTGQKMKKLGGDIQRQQRDLISLLLFFKNKESWHTRKNSDKTEEIGHFIHLPGIKIDMMLEEDNNYATWYSQNDISSDPYAEKNNTKLVHILYYSLHSIAQTPVFNITVQTET